MGAEKHFDRVFNPPLTTVGGPLELQKDFDRGFNPPFNPCLWPARAKPGFDRGFNGGFNEGCSAERRFKSTPFCDFAASRRKSTMLSESM